MLRRARALITFWHSRPSSSATSLIAAELLKQLDVTNDSKSLLIRVSYTSTSPEQSARIANAFAKAYLRTRAEKAAQQTLADLAATYGPKHPSVLKAQAQLEDALRSPIVSDNAQILAWASPPVLPSGPDRRFIVAVSFICSFAAGTILVLILERANTSFRSDAELAFKAKAPCLGIFAEDPTSPDFESCPCNSHGRWIRHSVRPAENLTRHVFGDQRRRNSGKHCNCSLPCPDGKASIAPRLVARGPEDLEITYA